jgi:5-methylcytosine-specific restriction endonuclease McrA
VRATAPALTKREALLAVCSLAPPLAQGACLWCGAELPPRRRSWCSDRCGDAFWANHWWSVARQSAKRRDRYSCRRCGVRAPKRPVQSAYASRARYLAAMRVWREKKRTGRMEVNHIVPCRGRHKALDCAHHLDNLETLCPPCHKEHTAALRPGKRPVQLGVGEVSEAGVPTGLP